MLRRVAIGLLWVVGAYLLGAFGGGLLVGLLSSNTHDRSVEAAMTGAFLFGPAAAVAGFMLGMWRARPRNTREPAHPDARTRTGPPGEDARSEDP